MDMGPETWRARQRRVLTELRGDRPQSTTALDAGLTLWRYIRMEEGETSLPAECLRPLAAAYRVPLTVLLEKLGLVDERAELIAAGYSPDEADTLIQKAAVLDQAARSGWLARQVQRKRRPKPRTETPPKATRRAVASVAG